MKPLHYLLLAFLLSACAVTPTTPEAPAPVDQVGAPADKPNLAGCPTFSFQAVDYVGAADQKFYDAMKALGVHTIIRYGDIPGNETIRGKIPQKAELDAIKKNGFYFLPIWQRNNRWANDKGVLYNTFNGKYGPIRGASDAEGMNKLYPNAPTWYYGVDFDAYTKDQLTGVENYGKAFREVANKYGKKVGAYGSGTSLKMLKEKGLIDYLWISMSTGFSGTFALTKSGDYHLLQKLWKQTCAGKSIDADFVNQKDFGQAAL